MSGQPTGATVTDDADARVHHRLLPPRARWPPITAAATSVEMPCARSVLSRAGEE